MLATLRLLGLSFSRVRIGGIYYTVLYAECTRLAKQVFFQPMPKPLRLLPAAAAKAAPARDNRVWQTATHAPVHNHL